MKNWFLLCFVSIFLLISCGPTYYVPNRPYGYQPNFTRTYTDKSAYRPSHYRNFVYENSQYLNDPSRLQQQPPYKNSGYDADSHYNRAARGGGKYYSTDGRSDDVYLVKSYLDTHAETERPVYHTTYTTSYNDNGEVTTTYTTDYVGTKKETQYWEEVKKEQKKAYTESRKKKKMKVKDYDD